MIAIALALGAGLFWGVGDFLGGVAARRLPTLAVVAISQVVGLISIFVVAAALSDGSLSPVAVGSAIAAGVAGAVGLAALYRGMAVGAMGVVAPISASAAVIPVAVGLVRGERPTALQFAGIAIALVGVVLASREQGRTGRLAAGVPLALVAATGFGVYFVFIDRASSDDALWAVVVARTASSVLGLAVAAGRRTLRVRRHDLPMIAAVGLFDVAANVFLAFAYTKGYVSIVSVLASLYPVVTIALAVVVLRERPSRIQAVGGVGALAGAALISAG